MGRAGQAAAITMEDRLKMEPILDIRNLEAGVDNRAILKGINLTILPGEVHAIMGPNGSGKCTLLRMIAGLESISAGTVSIDGKVVNAVGPTERDIAMVFQN